MQTAHGEYVAKGYAIRMHRGGSAGTGRGIGKWLNGGGRSFDRASPLYTLLAAPHIWPPCPSVLPPQPVAARFGAQLAPSAQIPYPTASATLPPPFNTMPAEQ